MDIMNHNSKYGKLARLLYNETSFVDTALQRLIDELGTSEEQLDKVIASLEAQAEEHTDDQEYDY